MTANLINRRKALTVVAAAPAAVVLGAAAVTALPAVGFARATTGQPSDDPLPEAIGRYRAEIAAVNATHGLTDEELDAWIDRADAIIMEAIGLPVLTVAGAVGVISLHVDQPLLAQHSWYGEEFLALVKSARDYVARALI